MPDITTPKSSCSAMAERVTNPARTHTCKLRPGHPGFHVCPLCDARWQFAPPTLNVVPPMPGGALWMCA